MPFVEMDPLRTHLWRQTHTADLRQELVRQRWKVTFLLRQVLGYTSQEPDPANEVGGTPRWTAHELDHVVPFNMRTDLASVPSALWGIVASYGRQTLPAVLHDMLCSASKQMAVPAERRATRRIADRLFVRTLREAQSGLPRRWVIWSAVRIGSTVALLATGLLTVTVEVAAIIAGLVGGVDALAPWAWAMLAAVALHLASIVWASWETEISHYGTSAGAFVKDPVEDSRARFTWSAAGSLLGATAIAWVAGPVLVPIGLVTLVVDFLLRLWERTLPEDRAADDRAVVAPLSFQPGVPIEDTNLIGNPRAQDI